MASYSIEALINKLESTGLLEKPQQAKVQILCTLNQYRLPLYLQILIALGAFTITFLFYYLLIVAHVIEIKNPINLTIWGSSLIFGAILVLNLFKNQTITIKVLSLQLSLILMWLGKLLLILGLTQLFKLLEIELLVGTNSRFALSMFIVTIITYFIYPVKWDRSVFSFLTLLSLLYYLFTLHIQGVLLTFFGLLTVMSGLLLLNDRKTELCDPLFYSAIIILCITSNVVLLGGLSILLAIALIFLGYWKHDNFLLGIGVLFLPLFLFCFFYFLNVSLNQKVMILLLSGTILFLFSRFLPHLIDKPDSHA